MPRRRRAHRRGPRHELAAPAQYEKLKDELHKRERARDFADRGGFTRFMDQVGRDIGVSVRDAPRGLATFGKAVGADLMYRDALKYARAAQTAKHKGTRSPPKPDPWSLLAPRKRALGRQVARGVVEDLRHPLRHPGRTLLTAASVATSGVGLGARGASALSAARTASHASKGRAPRVTVTRRRARELDPNKLGVNRLRKGLEADQPTPLRAGVKASLRRPTRGERVVAGGQSAYLSSRRQRAAEELKRMQANDRKFARHRR